MSAPRTKLLVAGLVLVGSITFLAFAGAKSGGWVYFLEVDKYLSDPQFANQRVRLHGKVATSDFSASAGSMSAEFKILGHTQALPVSYRGAIPDQFAAGREVVVEGKRDSAGVFQADVLMTKCASKYEPGTPHSKQHAPESSDNTNKAAEAAERS
jgi:cytochrome c-type biogenesis protein CcmE